MKTKDVMRPRAVPGKYITNPPVPGKYPLHINRKHSHRTCLLVWKQLKSTLNIHLSFLYSGSFVTIVSETLTTKVNNTSSSCKQ